MSLLTSAATISLESLPFCSYIFVVAVNEPIFNRAFYLPRLPREYYQGDAVVHWTNYILENPLRAELVKLPDKWPFSGALVPGYPTLHPLSGDFWQIFWKLYAKAKSADAGNILRGPIR